jgi:hypothetical protein
LDPGFSTGGFQRPGGYRGWNTHPLVASWHAVGRALAGCWKTCKEYCTGHVRPMPCRTQDPLSAGARARAFGIVQTFSRSKLLTIPTRALAAGSHTFPTAMDASNRLFLGAKGLLRYYVVYGIARPPSGVGVRASVLPTASIGSPIVLICLGFSVVDGLCEKF